MSLRKGLRIGIVGVTGALGSELVEVLEERSFPVAELLPVATDHSLGSEVELGGETVAVETEPPSLRGLDLLFLCIPADAVLEWVRLALHAEVPVIDFSGASAATGEIPLVAPDLAPSASLPDSPVVALPAASTLAWALALAPIHARWGLRSVVGTSFESACAGGREGLESLRSEVLALFNQQEAPPSTVFPTPVAFDCIPYIGALDAGAATDAEAGIARDLARLLGTDALAVAATAVRVPTFAGVGVSLAIETARPVAPGELRDLLAKAPGVEVWDEDRPGPTTREPVGRDVVLVGRVRPDPSRSNGTLLWLAADPVRIAAVNGVRLAEARLALG